MDCILYLRTSKSLVADITNIGLFTGMRADMSNEMVGPVIMASTETTLEVTILGLGCGLHYEIVTLYMGSCRGEKVRR